MSDFNSVQPNYLTPEQYKNLPDDKQDYYRRAVTKYARLSGYVECEYVKNQTALADAFNTDIRLLTLDLPTVGLGSDSSDLNSSLASIPQEEAVLSQTKDLPM